MADGRYFEIVNAPPINQKMSDFDEIGAQKQMTVIAPKFCYFKRVFWP